MAYTTQLLVATVVSPGAPGCLGPLMRRPDLRTTIATFADAVELLAQQAFTAAIVILGPADLQANGPAVKRLLNVLAEANVGTVVVAADATAVVAARIAPRDAVVVLPWHSDAGVLAGCILAFQQMQAAVSRLQQENRQLQRVEQQLGVMTKLDEEMRLAGRLQRDFLPRRLPAVGGCGFEVLFRPAGYVSGDIYDVFRLDEQHVGFYIADVMGHGMPAALLTMFIKRALRTKEIFNGGYRIVPPDEALHDLNAEVVSQEFSLNHFATIIYCVLDTQTLEMRYARAGHPSPLRICRDGIRPLEAEGALLGIFPGEHFPLETVQLNAGEQVLLYSDGFEEAFRPTEKGSCAEGIADLFHQHGAGGFGMLEQHLDRKPGTLHPQDDITAVMLALPPVAAAARRGVRAELLPA